MEASYGKRATLGRLGSDIGEEWTGVLLLVVSEGLMPVSRRDWPRNRTVGLVGAAVKPPVHRGWSHPNRRLPGITG